MRIKTWQYIVIGLLVVLAVFLIGLDAWLTPYDLGKERAAARAAGMPLSKAEFKRPKPPPAQDAAPEWMALAALLEKNDVNDDAVSRHTARPLPDAAMADIRRLLDERSDVMSLVYRATDKPEAFFEHTWQSNENLQYFVPMRQAARMLRWEALMLFRQGRVEEAVAVLNRGFRVADHAGQDPLIIGYLVSVAVEAITMSGFEDMLLEAGPNPRVTSRVRDAIVRHPTRRDLRYTMLGEALFGVTSMREMRSINSIRGMANPTVTTGPPPAPRRSNPLVAHYVAQQGEAAYLRWMTRLVEARRLPTYPERQAAVARVIHEMESRGRFQPPGDRVAGMVIPVFSKVEERDIAALAKRRVLLAACDVLESRARSGAWPAKIGDAAKVPLTDPFNGKPLGYRREGNGFVLYSVGADGTFAAKSGQPERGQAIFRYPSATMAGGRP